MAKTTVAYIGAAGVPIAVPLIWTQHVLPKQNTLCVMRIARAWRRASCKSVCRWLQSDDVIFLCSCELMVEKPAFDLECLVYF